MVGGALDQHVRRLGRRARASAARAHRRRRRDVRRHADLRDRRRDQRRSSPIPGARYPNRLSEPTKLVGDFSHCFNVLWADKLAQIALWVTTLLWGGAVTLQLLVLKWANANLGLSLSKAAVMQGVTGLGIALGAGAAAALIPLRKSLRVLAGRRPDRRGGDRHGVLQQGPVSGRRRRAHRLATFAPIYMVLAYPLMVLLGSLSGFFIVPMNAILQHRGATLLSAGHSIAVQNFNQNLAVLLMLGAYALLLTSQDAGAMDHRRVRHFHLVHDVARQTAQRTE